MTTVKIIRITLVLMMLTSTFIQSCKKDTGIVISTNSDTVKVIRNTAPVANAGESQYVFLPADSTILIGSATDRENNITSYSWKKLTGPAGASIEKSNSPETNVSGLHMGEYSFEFTVTDLMGLQGWDTVKVYVIQPGQNEMIFKDLVWMCPMGCTVSIENFYSFISRDKSFYVFLRNKTLSPFWQLVKRYDQWVNTDRYMYGIMDDKFWIYGDYETGTVDVKIQYLL